jgi:hypothetical protein
MIWISSAVFVLFVVAVVFYFVRRWRSMARHGRVAIPCDQKVQLPAGRLVIHYEDHRRLRFSEKPSPWSGFSVLVSGPEDDRRLDLHPPPESPGFNAGHRSRVPYATVNLPSAGGYRVVAQVDEDALDPHITFG